jgi:CelD/BcsL family acetyltransferase involved in cellulose biosynthesis
MQPVQVARLSEQHLAVVVALERQVYPPESQEPESLIRARLRYEDKHYSSLNLGLFADDKLIGYVLSHLDDGSDFRAYAVGDNLYVADMAILPEYRRHLIRLLAALAREVRIEYPGLPLVAHSIHDTREIWQRHEAVLRRLGFSITTIGENVTTTSGTTATLIMFRPLVKAPGPKRGRNVAVTPALKCYRTFSGKVLGTRVITDEDELVRLGESWRDIEKALPGLTIFQTHAYLAAWVRSFGLTRRLMIVCIYDGEELVGIAPFQVSLVEMYRENHRQLSFLGAPWEVDRPSFLFPRDARDCAEAAAQTLLARRDEWDVIWFHEQTAGDPALESFCATLANNGVLHGRVASSQCPYLTFEGSWQELLASKSQKFRKNLKAARRKLESAGHLEYECCKGDEDRLQELLVDYELLESHSWKAKAGGVGASQSVEHLRFYRSLIRAFGDSGQFVFRSLRLDGRMVAATFGLVHGRKYYSLHIVNDAEYAKFSPGTYLESLELEECFGAGLDEYDFLGGFLKNKLRWATRVRDTVEVHLYQRQPRLIAGYLFYFVIKPPLKRLQKGLMGNRMPVSKADEARLVE